MKTWILFLSIFAASAVFAQNTNLSNGIVFDGEPYIAVNPSNSQHLVVAWMGWVDFANKFQIKTKSSFDGGLTWSTVTELPHTVSGYSSADPCVDFNTNGDIYISYIDFTGTTPPVTGGVYICQSSDNGNSWSTPQEVINTNFDGTKWPIDRPWMVIDKSSGTTNGNIYVASFNLNRTNAPFNPYISVSTDNGNSFTTRYADTTDWLAGSLNPLPLCVPTVASDGTLYASYPSYVPTQSLYTQSFLALSEDAANSFSHKTILTNNPPANLSDFPLAKKGAPIFSNPANPDHLAYLYLSAQTGDLDVYLTETLDAGDTWTTPIRLNDDPISNNRMQDMIWGDFDDDGDLVVSWRDRRNGGDSTYQASAQIWAAYRDKDSSTFAPNFQITSQIVGHNTDLEEAGNDFMCIKLQNDTLSAVWGDPRDGEINIWFQQMYIDGSVLSVSQIASDAAPKMKVFPNPTADKISVQGISIQSVELINQKGKVVQSETFYNAPDFIELNISALPNGLYSLRIKTKYGTFSEAVLKD